jgi:alpha-ribazole phosphatase/probable phosphoglycerate mutase
MDRMSALLFIRHAETDMAGTFCGHSNPPINARGHQQIHVLLKTLHAEPIDAVCTSDLQRAATTADALAKAFACPSSTTSALREINFGEWEGLTWPEIETKDAAYAREWSNAYPNLPAPGGESFDAFQARVLAEVHHLLTLNGGGCFAVVTHGGVIRVVLRALCGLDEREAWEQTKSYCGFFRYKDGTGQ